MNAFAIKRIAAGLTQGALAEKLNVTQGAVSHWESGVAKPRTELLPKLAEVLGCTVDELLEETAGQ